jgi:hypothetical protein
MWFHILTIVFVCFKILGYIDWSWWIIFTPSLLAFGLILLFIVGGVSLALLVEKHK